MLKEVFIYVNPLDFVFLLIVGRGLYIGIRRGLLVEFFKFSGVFCSSFICLHYYPRLAGFFQKFIAFSKDANNVLAFVLLWAVVTVVFGFLREGAMLLQEKKEEKPSVLPWVAVFVAALRTILVGGLIFVAILLTGKSFLVNTAFQARSAVVLKSVAIGIYKGLYRTVVVRLFPEEEINGRAVLLDNPKNFIK